MPPDRTYAEAIELIVRRHQAGASGPVIAAELNAMGYRTQADGPWSRQQVIDRLRHRASRAAVPAALVKFPARSRREIAADLDLARRNKVGPGVVQSARAAGLDVVPDDDADTEADDLYELFGDDLRSITQTEGGDCA